MARRSDILALLTASLQSGTYVGTSLGTSQAQRGFRYIDQINDFPYISYSASSSALTHIGDDVRYSRMEIQLRGYVRGENAQDLSDQLALDIEDVLQSFRESASALDVVDCRILSVSTDEGLMEPYGIVDIAFECSYQHDEGV